MSKKEKLKILKEFLLKHIDGPAQGTQAWLDQRGIGGSELDMLISDPARLIAQKVGLDKLPDMLAMKWGNILEDTLRDTMKYILKTNIWEATSVPSALVAGKTYSMDGMGLVRLLCDRWNDEPYEFHMFFLALFEFKCLYSRAPEYGKVFSKYIPQVLSGMSDLQIPELCIYVEGVFRLARFDQLDNSPDCETWLQRDPNPRVLTPLSYGFLGFYIESHQLLNKIEDDWERRMLENWVARETTDFAKLESPKLLNVLFKYVKAGIVNVWHSDRCYFSKRFAQLDCDWLRGQRIKVPNKIVDMDTELKSYYFKFIEPQKFYNLGVLGFKLFDINIVTVEKDPLYTKKYESNITIATDQIKQLKSIADINEKREAYYQMFPEKRPPPEDMPDVDDPSSIESLMANNFDDFQRV
jgi:hypothetical protein